MVEEHLGKMKIVAVIPARSGSKSIKNKNIVKLGKHPLVAYSIAICKLSKLVDETVVSTDSMRIAYISKKYKANVPFLRPKKISRDNSSDYDFFTHYINYLKEKNKKIPDLLLHIRPTTPLRDLKIFNKGIKYFLKNKNFTSMRSVHQSNITPFKVFKNNNKSLVGFFPKIKKKEYYNLPRQKYPETLIPNGYIDIIKPEIMKNKTLHGKKILSFETGRITDIDTKQDLDFAKNEIKKTVYKKLTKYLDKLKN